MTFTTRPAHTSSSHTFVRLAIPLLIASVSACSALKFYPGEERADSTIGRLLFNTTGAEMKVITIDGIQHPHPGRTVELLPGPHRLDVKYQEQFESADAIGSNEGKVSDESSGLPMIRYGTCSLRFTIEESQELFVYVDAGSHPIIAHSIPPTVTLKEQGFDKPALFQERCQEEGQAPLAKTVS